MTEALKKMIQYDMNDYEEITNAGFICNLTQKTLDIISKLSEQVGAPTYIKTPIFLKKDTRVAGKHRVLISSDVTSRGIDVQQVRTVLNFDLPKCVFKYLHRIGRSGRWGRKGTAINFVTRWDMKTMKEIERHYHTIVDELPSNIAID